MRVFPGRVKPWLSAAVLLMGFGVAGGGPAPAASAATGPQSTAHSTSSATSATGQAGPGTGQTWSVQPTPQIKVPSGQIYGVSCSSAQACAAVGSTDAGQGGSVAETWDGSQWKLQDTPGSGNSSSLGGVSCVSASFCMAVGADQGGGPLAETWNGTRWTVQPTPSPGHMSWLDGVSCASSTACLAVGTIWWGQMQPRVPLVERWNGKAWSRVAITRPGGSAGLVAVSCGSATSCTAVGHQTKSRKQLPLIEHWNGSVLAPQQPATPPSGQGGLNAVSCPGTSGCVAVGNGGGQRPFAETGHGATWTVMSSPAAPGSLSGVSCTSLTACTADGSTQGAAPLAERWDGTSWAIQHTPAPSGAAHSTLSRISCPSGASCIAVGWYRTTAGAAKSLAEKWDGSDWVVQRMPNESFPAEGSFTGVSCAAQASCVAVGYYTASGQGNQTLLAETWNGTGWAASPIPQAAASSALQELNAVSCPSRSMCMAVGVGGLTRPLAEMWDGSRWTVVTPPKPTGPVADLSLYGVSCISATACVAVGNLGRTIRKTTTLAYAWNGTTWKMLPMPEVAAGNLAAVSCASAAACTAVGTASGKSWLAEAWNGTSWTVQSVPASPVANMTAVSCTSAAACTAVGGPPDTALKHRKQFVAERWDGTQWTAQQPAAAPSGTEFAEFGGVSCASATACTAVGAWWPQTSAVTGVAVQAWNGSTWTAEQAPRSGAHADAQLAAASCTSAAACTAVGDARGGGGADAPLAERSG